MSVLKSGGIEYITYSGPAAVMPSSSVGFGTKPNGITKIYLDQSHLKQRTTKIVLIMTKMGMSNGCLHP